jgi:hypothetical protein
MREAYTDEELHEIYDEWQKSKLSQKKYCEEKGLKKSLFKSELYQLRKREKKAGPEIGGFNLVKVAKKAEERDGEAYCEIRFTGGHRVTFSDKSSLLRLKSLIGDLIQG